MNSAMTICSKLAGTVRIAVLLLLLGSGLTVSAQSVLPGALSGTMQAVDQDNGSITISGTTYSIDNGVTKVYYDAAEIDSAILETGMVLRFTVNREGIVDRIEILGPASMLRGIDEH